MPTINTKSPAFKAKRSLEAEWNTFRKGLNLLLRPTELSREEYSQGDNIMLIGSGTPTGRWGTLQYFTANATGCIRGFGVYNNTTTETNELITLTDEGFLCKKNGTSSSLITGTSYPSGSQISAEQLGNELIIVSEDIPMVKYTGNIAVALATIPPPTNALATNISGATGTYIWSWKITALSPNGGETTPSTAVQLNNLPQDLSQTMVKVSWTAPLSAPTISGYQIYRGLPADETFLANVGPSITSYEDYGGVASDIILAPITNTTGGIKSKFITKVNDRFLMVDSSDKNKLLISGRYPNHTKFNWADGGGYIYIDPDSGQDITGIAVQPGSNKIIVYKDFSHYAVELSTVEIGNYLVLDPTYQPISTAIGASNSDTVITVENDIFYFGRKGLYVTGYEPNFLSLIRTNEISARMRPYLQDLNDNDYKTASAFYVDNKYILSFPLKKECIVYDRERGCFAGIWKLPFGITKLLKYVDTSGTERWVIGSCESNKVYTFESSINSDDGTTITKTLKVNKESFGDWSILKTIEFFNILFRNVSGEVNVSILVEDRSGQTQNVKTFTIIGSAVSGNSGFGSMLWGVGPFGNSRGGIVVGTDELPKWGTLFKQARLIQVEVVCNKANSNFELLSMKFSAKPQGKGSLSSSQRV